MRFGGVQKCDTHITLPENPGETMNVGFQCIQPLTQVVATPASAVGQYVIMAMRLVVWLHTPQCLHLLTCGVRQMEVEMRESFANAGFSIATFD